MTSQWSDNCDANTWQVISNLLDIDFIHCDIHGRSCKKMGNPYCIIVWRAGDQFNVTKDVSSWDLAQSWRCEIGFKMLVSLWNLAGASAVLPWHLPNFRAIGNSNHWSCTFVAMRDLMKRCLILNSPIQYKNVILPILVIWHFYIESGTRTQWPTNCQWKLLLITI